MCVGDMCDVMLCLYYSPWLFLSLNWCLCLDSLLQDLERATLTLKTHPSGGGGGGTWKLSKPNDPTISSAYSTAKVAKHYSPQYYVNDEVCWNGNKKKIYFQT